MQLTSCGEMTPDVGVIATGKKDDCVRAVGDWLLVE